MTTLHLYEAMPGGPDNIQLSNTDDLGAITLNQLTDVNAGSPSANQVIAYNASTGKWDAATQLTNELVDDPSPQLGANLDLNTKDITGVGSISTTANGAGIRNELQVNVNDLGSGSAQNTAGTLRLTKVASNTGRRNFLFFGTEQADGSGIINQASLDARWDGTRKRLRFLLPNDDFSSSVTPLELKHNQTTTETEIELSGQVNATNPSSQLIPSSMRMITVMDQPGVDDTQNHITCQNNYGSSTITDGNNLLYAFEAISDSVSEGRIGGIRASYGTNENNNEVVINAQSHDFGVTASKKIGTNLLRAFSDMPFQFPSFDTTARNAMTPSNGWVLYNTTDNKLQVYANGSWVDLH